MFKQIYDTETEKLYHYVEPQHAVDILISIKGDDECHIDELMDSCIIQGETVTNVVWIYNRCKGAL